MRNKATRTNEWEREHFGGSPLDPFESSKGYSTDGGAAFCFGGGTPDVTCWRAFLFAEGFLEATTNVYGLTLANRGAQRRTRPALFLVEGWGTRPQQRGRSFHDFPRCGLETAGFTVMSQLLKKHSHACGAKGRRRTPFPACRFLWSFRLQQRNRVVAL